MAQVVRERTSATTGRPRDRGAEALVKKVERACKVLRDPVAAADLLDAGGRPDEIQAWAARLEQQATRLEGVAGRLRRRVGEP